MNGFNVCIDRFGSWKRFRLFLSKLGCYFVSSSNLIKVDMLVSNPSVLNSTMFDQTLATSQKWYLPHMVLHNNCIMIGKQFAQWDRHTSKTAFKAIQPLLVFEILLLYILNMKYTCCRSIVFWYTLLAGNLNNITTIIVVSSYE